MKTAGLPSSRSHFGDDVPPRSASRPPARGRCSPIRRVAGRDELGRAVAVTLAVLDVTIGIGRKLGGAYALVALAVLFVQLLVLGETPRQLFPGTTDPALRLSLSTALFLVLAQGWDVPGQQLARDWARLRAHLPRGAGNLALRQRSAALAGIKPVVARLAALLDLGVAVSNKAGALAAFGSLACLGLHLATGTTLRAMYPGAVDPTLSLAADLGVDVLVLGWWSTSVAQIDALWRRVRTPSAADR